MKSSASVVSVLGDVVDSRAATDRRALHRRLSDVLDRVDEGLPSRHGVQVSVGDEFQGTYDSLGRALAAALRIRLLLLPEVDVRVGIGRGPVIDLDPARGLQDGPGWWAARAAIEEVETASRGTALRHLRTAYRADESASPPSALGAADAVNAALACQDELIGSLSERPARLLTGLLLGRTQTDLAAHEGISPSAVSQQVRSHGIGAILHTHDLLRRLP